MRAHQLRNRPHGQRHAGVGQKGDQLPGQAIPGRFPVALEGTQDQHVDLGGKDRDNGEQEHRAAVTQKLQSFFTGGRNGILEGSLKAPAQKTGEQGGCTPTQKRGFQIAMNEIGGDAKDAAAAVVRGIDEKRKLQPSGGLEETLVIFRDTIRRDPRRGGHSPSGDPFLAGQKGERMGRGACQERDQKAGGQAQLPGGGQPLLESRLAGRQRKPTWRSRIEAQFPELGKDSNT